MTPPFTRSAVLVIKLALLAMLLFAGAAIALARWRMRPAHGVLEPVAQQAGATLRALLPLLRDRPAADPWRSRIESHVRDWWKKSEERAMVKANPVNPQLVAWELSPLLPDHAIITSDSGSCANWYARDIKIRHGMDCSLSGSLASMGAAVPYAIAAKFAHPSRPVIAMVGDGAMQMNNMAELITIAKYWHTWANPTCVICVFNNEDLNQVTWEQRVMQGDPKFEATQRIPDVPYHQFATLIGLKGIFCNAPEKVALAWEEALASDRPVVLEFKTDPDETSMLGGMVRQVLNGILPGEKE